MRRLDEHPHPARDWNDRSPTALRAPRVAVETVSRRAVRGAPNFSGVIVTGRAIGFQTICGRPRPHWNRRNSQLHAGTLVNAACY